MTVQSQPVVPMSTSAIKRRRKIPNMDFLDMSTRWSTRRWEHSGLISIMATKFTLDSADDAIRFAEKAFGYWGWGLREGAIKPDPSKENHIDVELVFQHGGR